VLLDFTPKTSSGLGLKNGGMDREQVFSAIPHCGLSTGI